MAEVMDAVERRMLRPFEWGRSDCCLAVCDALADLGWPDPAEAYRGRYADEAGARAVMRGSVEDVAERETARLGWPEIDPESALPGDVGVFGRSLFIRTQAGWMGKSTQGVVIKKTVRKAWRPQ